MPYMVKLSLPYYDSSVGEDFINSRVDNIFAPYERDIHRSIQVLSDFQKNGTIGKYQGKRLKRELPGPIGLVMEGFLVHLESIHRNKTSILSHRSYMYRLLTYLESKQIKSVSDIKEIHIMTFLSTSANNKVFVVSSIRVFLRYLFEEQLSEFDLSSSLRRFKCSRGEKLPSVYSESEVLQIEGSIQRSNSTGKRNYAMMLLATRLGLRASDIAHLSFCHLDWEKSTVSFPQFKTGKEIQLPLLAIVGEALIDYLKYGRKKSVSERIFLCTCAPFAPMVNSGVSSALRRIIETSGVDSIRRKHGPHAMRHSLACRFLENKQPIPIISEALGHMNTDTTMSYLRIDIESLRQCALDVPPVSNHFYEQKGGAFYE